ncbi:Nif11-like leader peptide family natural product precursor [Mastigocoleus sp. MO_188.B34]|uniref:Nif11-like leader peptide family natural product precursor n=1 Tax=Mastigocoleus sp. MO_188.B34 TaxID=3036635 RepID=UPI00260D8748|nr:Nif11-like leader peptide family natural product precursor [Mastigocoleus sp. MO_188.B34]MDJ0693713.1 Nif11-like leader peptide family natural product precursor [Mastigocoleus sp. MO_188.B34]
MSKQNVIDFFRAISVNSKLQEKFNARNLAELIFHANNLGYEFTREDLASVIGRIEETVILKKIKEKTIGSRSKLWPKMWGKYHFQYVIEVLMSYFSEEELKELIR